jgi:hypothetical protein
MGCPTARTVIATCEYGGTINAAFRRQSSPPSSTGEVGPGELQLLAAFTASRRAFGMMDLLPAIDLRRAGRPAAAATSRREVVYDADPVAAEAFVAAGARWITSSIWTPPAPVSPQPGHSGGHRGGGGRLRPRADRRRRPLGR